MKSSRDAFEAWAPEVLETDAGGAAPPRTEGAWLPPAIDRAELPRTAGESRADARRAEFQRVMDEGERAGYERARAGLDSARRALLLAAAALEEERESFATTREQNLVALALAVSRHVVGRELAADPALVQELVRRALTLLPPDQPVTVRVHPEDLDGMRAVNLGGEGPSAGTPVRFAADAAITRGSFVIESPQRLVDGRTDVALRRLYERFDHA